MAENKPPDALRSNGPEQKFAMKESGGAQTDALLFLKQNVPPADIQWRVDASDRTKAVFVYRGVVADWIPLVNFEKKSEQEQRAALQKVMNDLKGNYEKYLAGNMKKLLQGLVLPEGMKAEMNESTLILLYGGTSMGYSCSLLRGPSDKATRDTIFQQAKTFKEQIDQKSEDVPTFLKKNVPPECTWRVDTFEGKKSVVFVYRGTVAEWIPLSNFAEKKDVTERKKELQRVVLLLEGKYQKYLESQLTVKPQPKGEKKTASELPQGIPAKTEKPNDELQSLRDVLRDPKLLPKGMLCGIEYVAEMKMDYIRFTYRGVSRSIPYRNFLAPSADAIKALIRTEAERIRLELDEIVDANSDPRKQQLFLRIQSFVPKGIICSREGNGLHFQEGNSGFGMDIRSFEDLTDDELRPVFTKKFAFIKEAVSTRGNPFEDVRDAMVSTRRPDGLAGIHWSEQTLDWVFENRSQLWAKEKYSLSDDAEIMLKKQMGPAREEKTVTLQAVNENGFKYACVVNGEVWYVAGQKMGIEEKDKYLFTFVAKDADGKPDYLMQTSIGVDPALEKMGFPSDFIALKKRLSDARLHRASELRDDAGEKGFDLPRDRDIYYIAMQATDADDHNGAIRKGRYQARLLPSALAGAGYRMVCGESIATEVHSEKPAAVLEQLIQNGYRKGMRDFYIRLDAHGSVMGMNFGGQLSFEDLASIVRAHPDSRFFFDTTACHGGSIPGGMQRFVDSLDADEGRVVAISHTKEHVVNYENFTQILCVFLNKMRVHSADAPKTLGEALYRTDLIVKGIDKIDAEFYKSMPGAPSLRTAEKERSKDSPLPS